VCRLRFYSWRSSSESYSFQEITKTEVWSHVYNQIPRVFYIFEIFIIYSCPCTNVRNWDISPAVALPLNANIISALWYNHSDKAFSKISFKRKTKKNIGHVCIEPLRMQMMKNGNSSNFYNIKNFYFSILNSYHFCEETIFVTKKRLTGKNYYYLVTYNLRLKGKNTKSFNVNSLNS
jgi:hypothetical protein